MLQIALLSFQTHYYLLDASVKPALHNWCSCADHCSPGWLHYMADKPSNTRAAEAACVEDYNDESETAVPETRKTANITAKRSKLDGTKPQVARDEFSDSGHSSQTLATLGSTNSSLQSKSGLDTIRAESHAVAGKTRPTKGEQKSHSKSRSPEKPLSQKAASNSRKEEIARKESCSCRGCVAKARHATSHHPSKSTGKARAPVPEVSQPMRRAQVPQHAPSRPRASTSLSYHRERPLSLYAGVASESLYIQSPQPIYVESPPTVSYAPTAPIVSPSYPPHPTSYFPPPQPIHQAQQIYTSQPSPYENWPHPRPRHWTSDDHLPSRPQSVLYTTTPIIEHVEPVYAPVPPSARPISRQLSHRECPRALPEQHSARDEDYYNMPPPAPPPPRLNTASHQDRRPAIRHAVTAEGRPTLTHRRTVRDESTTAHVGHESPVKQSHGAHERAGRLSRNTSNETVPKTHSIERGMVRTNIESDAAKRRRRATVYGHESFNELTDGVEAYQASRGNGRTSHHIPISPTLLMRKKTHTSSKSSETSSRKSGKSGKSRTSKTSRAGSDLKSRRPSENEKFSMRVDASHDVNVDLKGGMEGRRISVRHKKDEGEMEFSIGSRGRTTAGRESREKSRKHYSDRDGQSETAIERTRTTSRPPMKMRENEENEPEPRIVRERIMTRTRSLGGSSRVRGERVDFV